MGAVATKMVAGRRITAAPREAAGRRALPGSRRGRWRCRRAKRRRGRCRAPRPGLPAVARWAPRRARRRPGRGEARRPIRGATYGPRRGATSTIGAELRARRRRPRSPPARGRSRARRRQVGSTPLRIDASEAHAVGIACARRMPGPDGRVTTRSAERVPRWFRRRRSAPRRSAATSVPGAWTITTLGGQRAAVMSYAVDPDQDPLKPAS